MLEEFIAGLDAIDPRLWPLTLAVVVYVLVQIWKVAHRASFDALPPRVRALPPVLIAAVLSATARQLDSWPQLFTDVLLGGLSGTLAVGGHETVARLRDRPRGEVARAVEETGGLRPRVTAEDPPAPAVVVDPEDADLAVLKGDSRPPPADG